jgi:hypothetical protein
MVRLSLRIANAVTLAKSGAWLTHSNDEREGSSLEKDHFESRDLLGTLFRHIIHVAPPGATWQGPHFPWGTASFPLYELQYLISGEEPPGPDVCSGFPGAESARCQVHGVWAWAQESTGQLHFFCFVFCVGVGFELRTSHLQSRYSTTWATPSDHFCSSYFGDWVSWTICLDSPWMVVLPPNVSQPDTRITGVSCQ